MFLDKMQHAFVRQCFAAACQHNPLKQLTKLQKTKVPRERLLENESK